MHRWTSLLFMIALLFAGAPLPAITVSHDDAEKIAVKIWKNECAGKIEGLTTWNQGENFASLGIGHFIWYHSGCKNEPFQETFPELLKFIASQGHALPVWLEDYPPCPWNSREEFYDDISSPLMTNLRQFLFETKNLQALFMAKRMENALPKILDGLSADEKAKVTIIFYRLADTPQGLFALIDYINFKGLGISPKESYQGKAWGLKQVLLAIDPTTPNPVKAFTESAKAILAERVKNSPPDRNEERWLKGWQNRLDQY